MPFLKRSAPFAGVFFLAGILGYWIFLWSYPYIRVHQTLSAITRGSFRENIWFYIPKLDDRNREVPRTSSDVLYAYCLFDLSEGDVMVELAPWGKYQSASIFSLNSDHHQTVRSLEGLPVKFVLRKKDFPFDEGFIMMRRLVWDKNTHLLNDRCKRL